MMCVIHYISALRRLKESNKTVMMLGGVDEAPPMIVAQNEMIGYEVQYYEEETLKLIMLIVVLLLVSVPAYIWFFKG